MMLVKTEKRQSTIHGIGLFAAERVPAGTPTWRFTPGVDQAIHPEVLERIPAAARGGFLTYAYLDVRTGLYVLCADDARFMNHSDDPNVRGNYEMEEVFGEDVAARDIEVGEEFLCDYRTFDRIDRQGLTFPVNGG
ncbi:MAG TPA: SET domain-containing protein [Longimicrobiales bacterium]|nr:SET domain-containing protein [Longimicrobiales bacterium]